MHYGYPLTRFKLKSLPYSINLCPFGVSKIAFVIILFIVFSRSSLSGPVCIFSCPIHLRFCIIARALLFCFIQTFSPIVQCTLHSFTTDLLTFFLLLRSYSCSLIFLAAAPKLIQTSIICAEASPYIFPPVNYAVI